jgi:cation:H+ antiporter
LLVSELIAALVIIVCAAEIFTNALEHLGARLRISEGVTGSLFAAVGTAMPESIIPILALLAGTSDRAVNEEIGVGAILGAPLMLSTLTLGLMSASVLRKRGIAGPLRPEKSGLDRDLDFVLVAFAVATAALFIPHHATSVRMVLAASLGLIYFVYALLTVRASAGLVDSGHGTEIDRPLFTTWLGVGENPVSIILQLLLGLGLLIGGAELFIHSVKYVADLLGVSALLLSLLIIPIATELPEKVNSILWIRRGRDTLAFGNITGAMVFQGTLLPAIGILLTPWEPRREILTGIVLTYLAALWLRLLRGRRVMVWHLFVNGAVYVLYLVLMLTV